MGGLIVQLVALSAPEIISGLIVGCSFPNNPIGNKGLAEKASQFGALARNGYDLKVKMTCTVHIQKRMHTKSSNCENILPPS